MELLRVKTLTIAVQYLERALTSVPNDPFVLNEMGAVLFEQARYAEAETMFRGAIEHLSQSQSASNRKWRATFWVNCGHAARKMKRYDAAMEAYEECIATAPELQGTAYSGIGLCHHLQGRLQEAIDSYHKALAMERSEFAQAAWSQALEEFMLLPLGGEGGQE
jgi:anaphase-promoting complex subunit 6